jgi:prolyl-tRNA editing enzyme YbaK/EbsC (Cys-tRNA(Pro) deacylase)
MNESTLRVAEALKKLGKHIAIKEMPQTTRSAKEAAIAIGCTVPQIVKSLVFATAQSNRPVLALVSGGNQLDEKKLEQIVGEGITKPNADFVREKTGFVIGGVAPVGHTGDLPCYIDRDLLQFNTIWAAAGTPFTVFEITPDDLVAASGGEVLDLKK